MGRSSLPPQEIRKSAVKNENNAAGKIVLEVILLQDECVQCNAMICWIFCEEGDGLMPKMRPLQKDIFSEKYTLLYSAVDIVGDAGLDGLCPEAACVCF
jgi:Pyruvate/2-oxoacid:ferredoxin oxidoreductase delta subunit